MIEAWGVEFSQPIIFVSAEGNEPFTPTCFHTVILGQCTQIQSGKAFMTRVVLPRFEMELVLEFKVSVYEW